MAGRWLGEVHLAASVSAGLEARLPARELGRYVQLLGGCRATLLDHLARNTLLASGDAAVFRRVVAHCDVLESHWHEIETICEAMPRTLVHGDFVIKNARIRDGAAGPALLVYDWELAGWGRPGADLAQFLGCVASPDLGIYHSVLKRGHPHLDLRDVQRVAACGNLLRLADCIDWALSELKFGSYLFLPRPVSTLALYLDPLVEALSAFGWRGA